MLTILAEEAAASHGVGSLNSPSQPFEVGRVQGRHIHI